MAPLLTPGDLEQAFAGASEETRRRIAEDLAPFMWAQLTSRVYNDVRDDRKIRVTSSGEDVVVSDSGREIKYAGESYFDHLNFYGTVTVESSVRGRQANIALGAGADCMFDHLVSTCWATEVANGRGVEGETKRTASGCTFRMWSSPFGAGGAIAAMNAAAATAAGLGEADDQVLYICGGTYAQTATQTVTPNTYSSFRIVGAGQQATTLQAAADSIIMFSVGAIQQGAVFTVEELCFDMTTLAHTLSTAIDFGSSTQASIHNNTFQVGSLNVGIKPGASSAECRIYDNIFNGGGAGIGTDTTGNHLSAWGNSFIGMDRGVVMSNNAQHTIADNLFYQCTTGIEFSGNSSSTDCIIANNRFNDCVKGINALTGTNIQYNTVIVGNNFLIGANNEGIDFSSMNASGLITTWQIGPNTFRATDSTARGIVGDASFTVNQITNNVFRNFTSGNEISGLAATTVAAHNISDAGAIADNGSPVGHAGSGSGGAASNAEPFVTIGNTSGLSAERALTTSASVEVVDGGANSSVTLRAIQVTDDDADTKWQAEESADEDILRADTAGTERVQITSGATAAMSLVGALLRIPATSKTISSDTLAVADGNRSHWRVSAQTSTVDDLDGITGGTVGDWLLLRAQANHIITVKHENAGASSGDRFVTKSRQDVVIRENNFALFVKAAVADSGLADAWVEVSNPYEFGNLPYAIDLTIASGVITLSEHHHTIDTEAAAASDDLVTINGLKINQLYLLRPTSGARTVVLKHGSGNILCVGNADITLDDAQDFVWVFTPDGVTAYALQGGAGGAGGTNALLDGSAHTDTTNSPATRGDIIIANSTPAWDDLAISGTYQALISDGTDPAWRDPIPKGTYASRPAASAANVGRLYMATDRANTLYLCDSSSTWAVVNPRTCTLRWNIDGRLRADASNGQGPIRYLPDLDGMTTEAVALWKPVRCKVHLRTASAGASVIVQIEFGTTATPGTDLFASGDRPTMAAAAVEATSTTFADSAIENGTAFEVVIDQVGSTSGSEGTDLSVELEFVQIDG